MEAADPLIGTDLLDGQFKILKKIGAGGMGAVYKALQPDMNRYVAVKVLHAKLLERKDIVSRFRREARAISHLTHPNTVRVFLHGELPDGSLYIVMEYLEGINLNQTARRGGPMRVERAVPIIAQVCRALDEAHRAGMIHRDLKPENIFICDQGGIKDYAKVLDFGLAKVTEREMRPGSVALTQEGMVFGTPEFMSPEQAQGLALTPASDIYALAVILYEVLTGKLPFDARNAVQFLQAHTTKAPLPINERAPGIEVPEAVWFVIEKALAKNPSARFTTAGEFAEALEAAIVPHSSGLQMRGEYTEVPVTSVVRMASTSPTTGARAAATPLSLPAPAPAAEAKLMRELVADSPLRGGAASVVKSAGPLAVAAPGTSSGTFSGAPPARVPSWIWIAIALAFVAGVAVTALVMRGAH